MADVKSFKPSEFLHASVFGVEDFKGEITEYHGVIRNRMRLALRRIGRRTRARLISNIQSTFTRRTGTLEDGVFSKFREDGPVMGVTIGLTKDAYYGFMLEAGGGKQYTGAPREGEAGSKLWKAVFGHLRAKKRKHSGQVGNRNPNWSLPPRPFAMPAFEFGQDWFKDEMEKVGREKLTAAERRRTY